jgi:G3E family GTPase
MDAVCYWQQAGPVGYTGKTGRWWADVPKVQWPEGVKARERIAKNWAEPYGDRRQEMVFIGVGIDPVEITSELDACLLTEEEMAEGVKGWSRLADPFPAW